MRRIKKPTYISENTSIKKPSFIKSTKGISFSFQIFETTEYFNLDGTCPKWTLDLFNMMKSVSEIPQIDLMRNAYSTYRVHQHADAKPPCKVPIGIELKDFYQIRISTSKGGIHGVFYEDVFYIVWLDPLHNMYPNDRFGGLRKISPLSTCCKDRDEEITLLKQKNVDLEKDVEELLSK